MFHTLGQSLPPGVFGPIQMHCILCNKKWDYILTTSSGPPLPPRRLTSFVPCVLLQCYWNLEIPDSTNRPPLWSAFCLEFTLSDVARPDLRPTPPPIWAVSCLHLMEVLVGVIFSC